MIMLVDMCLRIRQLRIKYREGLLLSAKVSPIFMETHNFPHRNVRCFALLTTVSIVLTWFMHGADASFC
jgi:hypothetical protein